MKPKNVWLDTTINIPFVTDSGYIALKYKTIGAAWVTSKVDNIAINIPLLGINEKDNYNKITVTIFPNPFKSSTTIQFGNQ